MAIKKKNVLVEVAKSKQDLVNNNVGVSFSEGGMSIHMNNGTTFFLDKGTMNGLFIEMFNEIVESATDDERYGLIEWLSIILQDLKEN